MDLHVAGLICLGFVIRDPGNAKIAMGLSNTAWGRVFGAALLLSSLMIFVRSQAATIQFHARSPCISTGSLYLPLIFYFTLIAFLRRGK